MNGRQAFVIAHISDLHLTANDGDWRSEPRLLGRLRGMNDAFRKIVGSKTLQEADLVLVTGDITDTGASDTVERFWNIMQSAGLAAKTVALPGNHDTCNLRFFRRRGNRLHCQEPRRVRSDIQSTQLLLSLTPEWHCSA